MSRSSGIASHVDKSRVISPLFYSLITGDGRFDTRRTKFACTKVKFDFNERTNAFRSKATDNFCASYGPDVALRIGNSAVKTRRFVHYDPTSCPNIQTFPSVHFFLFYRRKFSAGEKRYESGSARSTNHSERFPLRSLKREQFDFHTAIPLDDLYVYMAIIEKLWFTDNPRRTRILNILTK